MRKPSRKTLRNKCDKLWASIIRKRNGGKCEICNAKANNPHHICSRRNLTLRWDLRNGILLCSGCHTLKARESAHGDPIWFIQWMMQNRPDDYNYLFEKREEITTYLDYETLLKSLEKEVRKNGRTN